MLMLCTRCAAHIYTCHKAHLHLSQSARHATCITLCYVLLGTWESCQQVLVMKLGVHLRICIVAQLLTPLLDKPRPNLALRGTLNTRNTNTQPDGAGETLSTQGHGSMMQAEMIAGNLVLNYMLLEYAERTGKHGHAYAGGHAAPGYSSNAL